MPVTFTVFGYEVERAAILRGTAVATVALLLFGVGLGSFVEEDSDASIVVTALIAVGFIAGGVAAGVLSSRNHIVHGAVSSVPAASLAIVINLIRLIVDGSHVGWLNVVFVSFFLTSLGTLGGMIGGRFAPARRSLLR